MIALFEDIVWYEYTTDYDLSTFNAKQYGFGFHFTAD